MKATLPKSLIWNLFLSFEIFDLLQRRKTTDDCAISKEERRTASEDRKVDGKTPNSTETLSAELGEAFCDVIYP